MPAHQPILVGIDSFSYHRYFGEVGPWETEIAVRWTVHDFLSRARELEVDAVSLQTVYLPDLTLESAPAMRAELDRYELEPVLAWGHRSGLEGGTSPSKMASFKRTLPVAQALGCKIVRLVAGDQFQWAVPPSERIARLIPLLRDLAAEAFALDLTLAVENHADFTAGDLVVLVERVGAPNLGICFDTGNAVRVGDDLLRATDLAAPWIRMVQIRDLVPLEGSQGDPTAWWPSAPLGRGRLDMLPFLARLTTSGFRGAVFVEMANTWPEWANEDRAVSESVRFLRDYFAKVSG